MSKFLFSCLVCAICFGAAACVPINTGSEQTEDVQVREKYAITETVCAQIKPGMTEEQVQELLGRPPDIESELNALQRVDGKGMICIPSWQMIWRDDKSEIRVHFRFFGSKSGRRVTGARFVNDKEIEIIRISEE